MGDFLKQLIYLQNKELLMRISQDKFVSKDEQECFMNKYHKKNFSDIHIIKKDTIKTYEKKI